MFSGAFVENSLPYAVSFDRVETVDDHIKFSFVVKHCSGASWRARRRFSEFTRLNDVLESDIKDNLSLPLLQWSWLPSFAQSSDSEFCEQRLKELQKYLDAVLQAPKLVEHPAVQAFLAIGYPEPPAGVRIVQGQSGYKLELRLSSEAESGPVDAYRAQITHAETGVSFQVVRPTCPETRQLQTVHIGYLDAGKHCCSVVALNRVGESAPVRLVVQVAPTSLAPASEPQFAPRCPEMHGAAGDVAHACPAWDPREPKLCAAAAFVDTFPRADNGEDDDGKCVVCLAEAKTHAFVPCGHRCVCARCAELLVCQQKAACPVCRVPAERALQIYT